MWVLQRKSLLDVGLLLMLMLLRMDVPGRLLLLAWVLCVLRSKVLGLLRLVMLLELLLSLL